MIRERPSRSHRELDLAWLELTRLKRDTETLCVAFSDAGLEVEVLTATLIVNGLRARLDEISEELRSIGSDQPSL